MIYLLTLVVAGVALGLNTGKILAKIHESLSFLDPVPNDSGNKIPWFKIIIISVIGAVGVLLVRFISKLLGVKLFSKKI